MAHPVFEQIRNHPNLPSPRGVVLEILRLARCEETGLHQIARVIETDPALTGRLLKVINSPAMSVGRPVGAVQQAAALLGMRAVTQLALAFTLMEDYRKGQGISDPTAFWSASLGRAVAMRQLSYSLNAGCPEEAFTCGLLSNIGGLALMCVFPDKYLPQDASAESESFLAVLETERRTLGIDRVTLTAEMLEDWHLPNSFSVAIRSLASEETSHGNRRSAGFPEMLRAAAAMANVLVSKVVGYDFLTALIRRAQALGIEPLEFIELFDRTSEDWGTTGRIFSVRTRQVPSLPELYGEARKLQSGLQAETAYSPARTPHRSGCIVATPPGRQPAEAR